MLSRLVMLSFRLPINTQLAGPNAPRVLVLWVEATKTPQDAYEMQQIQSQSARELLL